MNLVALGDIKMKCALVSFLIVILLSSFAFGQLPAFPTAEGYGAAATGWRGGQVIHVTNLNATGPGSFQAALDVNAPRIVVFDVSGEINANPFLRNPDIYIAGQTAPGAGITINGMFSSIWQNVDSPDYPRFPPLHDVVIRHIRVRATGPGGSSGDCFQLPDINRLMLDHVSAA